MAAGIQVDKPAINGAVGTYARTLHQTFLAIDALKVYLDSTTDATLISMGFTQAECDDMKSAYADLAQLSTLYKGGATLGSAKDFRTFAKRLHGLGI